LAAVLRYPGRDWADFGGAFVNDHPVLAKVCDDGDRRGDRAPVLVAHTTAAFAERHLADPAAASAEVAAAVRELLALPRPAVEAFVHRWTYAQPAGPAPAQTCFHLDDAGVGLAGDAFGPARVQTAWLSGHLLGSALARRLRG
ncbi:MAG TPA: NAD/FAD-dependent oxidoreductase, partial [Pilimelia sp.]|nr:NAD/FAD-dependent oxidoreductase [Pilimelia sp.]